ncbi:MAG: Na/Pi cotransporter family protein, partial [Clostridia bacterium]|nr:Na/Pi cotransporter family protein [Clostridia bacterium]
EKAVGLLFEYDAKVVKEIEEEEDNVDVMADRVSNYLVQLSPHISSDLHVRILDQYYKVVTEFERLSDHAMNISEVATNLHDNNSKFSDDAKYEISVLVSVINRILEYTQQAFEKRDEVAAKHIEPLEEVVDDLVNALKENHLARLRAGRCNVYMDTGFSNLMSDLERISDVCSNVGVATVVRAERDIEIKTHDYISALHQGRDETFNEEYSAAHEKYFTMLENRDPNESATSTPSSEAFLPPAGTAADEVPADEKPADSEPAGD